MYCALEGTYTAQSVSLVDFSYHKLQVSHSYHTTKPHTSVGAQFLPSKKITQLGHQSKIPPRPITSRRHNPRQRPRPLSSLHSARRCPRSRLPSNNRLLGRIPLVLLRPPRCTNNRKPNPSRQHRHWHSDRRREYELYTRHGCACFQ